MLIQEHHMGNEATEATIIFKETSRESTNLDGGLQSGAGIISYLTGLMHHLHLLHHEIYLEKGLPGGTRESSGVWYAMKSDDGNAVGPAIGSDAWTCTRAADV